MPYDPEKPDVFRDILKDLAKKSGLSSQRAIDVTQRWRAANKVTAPFGLTTTSLDRFKRGERVTAQGFGQLWNALDADPDYGWAFKNSPTADGLFGAISGLWPIDQPTQAILPGTYQFFATGEDLPDRVVFGAIEIDGNGGVVERQRISATRQIFETWTGTAVASAGHILLLLSPTGSVGAKVYFLSYRSSTKVGDRTASLHDVQGTMTKTGKNIDVFQSGIYLHPRPNAVEETKVVHTSELPNAFPEEIRAPEILTIVRNVLKLPE